MKTEYISDYHMLTLRLKELAAEREVYENRISSNLKELSEIVQNPAPIIKRTVKELAEDSAVQADLLKLGINTAVNFIVERFSGKAADAASGDGELSRSGDSDDRPDGEVGPANKGAWLAEETSGGGMSGMSKALIALIVLAGAAGAVYWFVFRG